MSTKSSMTAKAEEKAKQLFQRLNELKREGTIERIVFAESCTAGLVSALVGQVPGISEFFCGSVVTCRASAMQQWLNMPSETLESNSAESAKISSAMAVGVLAKTNEATCSAAITGHLSVLRDIGTIPRGQSEVGGVIFVTVAAKNESGQAVTIAVGTHRLQSRSRIERQYEAAANVIEMITDLLKGEFYSSNDDACGNDN